MKEFSDFKKGVIYGILVSVFAVLVVNIGYSLYSRFVTKDLLYEAKAKTIYSLMDDKFTGDIDKKKMYEGIYTGMVYGIGDKYSTYISEEEYENFKMHTEGNYYGIGAITIYDSESGNIYVDAVYENSPAEKAGLQSGDVLKKVEDFEITYETYSDAIERIRGEKGTKFNLTYYRPSENKTYTTEITRDEVYTPTVSHTVLDNGIGYLRISGFEGVTVDQFKTNANALKAANIKSLIIDLRNNPGGLLTTVSEIADEFLDEGIITYTEDKKGNKEYVRSKEGKWDIPVAILVNGNSASASELLTGALKDEGIAKVVGTNTYGKGVVQTTFPFKDGSALKITTSKYYTPKGVCIDGVGIAPDYEVEAEDGFSLGIIRNNNAICDTENDVQLKKAIEILE